MPQLPLALLALVLAACSAAPSIEPSLSPSSSEPLPGRTLRPAVGGPTAEPSQSPFSHGPAGLVEDLRTLGLEAEQASEFAGDPISTLGVLLCVEDEPVQVYVFGTPDEAAAMASRIDRDDPSNFGSAIIEWAGEPKFWLRDRILVLYLGTDEEVLAALISLMGQPFAQGHGRPPLRGDAGC